MINLNKLDTILTQYKRVFISKHWPQEKYKWIAIQVFQDNWDINADDFVNMWLTSTDKIKNLLKSRNYFPRGMIKALAGADQAAVRDMFHNLYDESQDLKARVESFASKAEEIRLEFGNDKWNKHYQDVKAISTYLWLRYPDKYYIFKHTEVTNLSKQLDYHFMPRRGEAVKNLLESYKLYDEIKSNVIKDEELVRIYRSVLTNDCYSDPNLTTLVNDLGYFTDRIYPALESDWFPADYSPNISVSAWGELLRDRSVFTSTSLEIMKRFKDIGGAATCKQLSLKYGENINFYNAGSVGLAQRVAQKTGCPLNTRDTENAKWWPILYVGKHADGETNGTYIWKIREELSQALDDFDMSEIGLYKIESEQQEIKGYWWINSDPEHWKFSDFHVGDEYGCSLMDEFGEKRIIYQNFLEAKAGDLIIGYETSPINKIVAIGKIAQENDGNNLYFEITEQLEYPIDLALLKNRPELEDMEYFQHLQGSLFKLTKEEFESIQELIQEGNPLSQEGKLEEYTKDNFLQEVYMDETDYEDLIALIKNKQNVILQGPPGVGKTFAATRLAYSMMGVKDNQRIEFVQFHQSYSYEDFIMGYRPVDEGFELKSGIFLRFCQKAVNNPNQKYFFLIDEINRGNISKIFGELLMLIEKDYRNRNATLAYSGVAFSVPDNIYIIGMMNTADRSLAMIDYALRRRFGFFEFEPAFQSTGFTTYQKSLNNDLFDTLIELIEELNREISRDNSLGDGFQIGHSYFCNQSSCEEQWLQSVVKHDIKPLLKEYWFDNPNKWKSWETKLLGIFDE